MRLFRNYLAESLTREIEELKKSHARELSYVTNELSKLQDEYQRLVRVVMPTMQGVNLPKEVEKADKEPAPIVFGPSSQGSSWQRVQAEYFEMLAKEDERKGKKPQFVFTTEGPVKTQEI